MKKKITIMLILLLSNRYSVQSQILITENFDYTASTSLTSNNWMQVAAATPLLSIANYGLTYTGYNLSAIGNAAKIDTSGQDVYRNLNNNVTVGNLYTSLMININKVTTFGDYFFAYLPQTSTTAYTARLFAKAASSGYYKIGISKASDLPIYSEDSFALNTTSLLVIKYQFNTGTLNDSLVVYNITSGFPTSEPNIATVATIGGTSADAVTLGRLALRQGNALNAPRLLIDGIRSATSWANLNTSCSLNNLILPDTTIAFKQDSILLNAGTGYSSYIWNRGDTTQSIWVNTSGIYKVTVLNSLGCSSIDSTNVIFVKGIQQKDTSICAGKSINLSIPSGTIPTNGLVGYWPFTGNANDVSGNGNNGTVNGATLTSDRFGNLNSAFTFDGINDYISTLRNYQSAFSVSIWVNTPNISGLNPLIDGFDSNWEVQLNDLYPDFVSFISSTNYQEFISTTSILSNNWTHIVCTFNANILKLYINGVFKNQFTVYSLPINSGNYFFGASFSGVDQFYLGKLDDIGIWNRSLNQTEIQALFNGGNANTKITWSTNDTTNSILVTPTTSTTYSCTQRIGNFTMTDSVRVTVNALPIINSLTDTTIAFKQDSILLNAGSGYSKYVWSRGDTTQSIWVKTAGINKVTVFNSTGCSNSDSTNVIFVKGIQQKDTSICAGKSINLSIPFGTIPTNGLVAWYPFNGNANDASGNGNNLISNGSPTFVNNYLNNVNSACNFTSGNDYYLTPSSSFSLINNFSQGTLSFWVKINSHYISNHYFGIDNSFIVKQKHGVGSDLFCGLYGGTTKIRFGVSNAFPNTTDLIGTTNLNLNQWYNIIGTWDGTNVKLYVNGVLDASQISSVGMSNRPSPDYMSIGSCLFGGNSTNPSGAYGAMSDVVIYNRKISNSEIQTLFNGGNANTKVNWSTNDTTNSILVSPNTSTTYRCTQRIGSFTLIDSMRVTVNALPNINSLTDTTIAFKQDSILLNAGSGYSKYLWSRGDTTQSIWIKTAGINKVTVFNSTGCSNSDSTNVIFVKGIQQKDTSICLGKSINLSIPSGTIPTNGLVGYWPFTGNANDVSGNGNNGLVNGANLVIGRLGNANTAYLFNGTSSNISLVNPFLGGNQNTTFTFHALIYTNSTNSRQVIWSKTLFWGEIAFEVSNLNEVRFAWANSITGNKYSTIYSQPNVIQQYQWYDIVVTFENSVGQIYLNGLPIVTNLRWTAQGGLSLSTSQIEASCNFAQDANSSKIGTYQSGAFFNGKIDEFGIWNRALTSYEINLLYGGYNDITKNLWSTSDTTNIITVAPTTSTTYRCTQRIGSFTMTDSVRVMVNALPIITLPDTTIAFKQDSIILNAGAGYSKYVWSGGDTTQSIWVKTAGMNKVTVFNSLGCSNSDSTNVIFVKGIQQKDTSICSGNGVKLSILSGTIPTNGLVGYWPFSGNANDISGNGNDGTVYNATLTHDRNGMINSAYDFNGNGKIICPQNSIPTQTLSLSVWVNQDFSFASREFVCLGSPSSTRWGAIASTNNINLNYGAGCDNQGGTILNSVPISTGNWIHLVYISSGVGGNTQIYKNGVFVGQAQNSTSTGSCSTQNLYFGVDIFSSPEYIDGKLDDISIYNRALTNNEIQALYNNGGTNANTKVNWSTNDTTNSITLTPTTSTTYRCTQQIGSFIMTDSVKVTVNALPVINSLLDTTIAFKQDSILLNAGTGYSKYIWSRGDTTQSIWIKSAGMYKVTVLNSAGCGNIDSTRVLFVKGISNKDTSVCQNTFVNINTLNQVNIKYLWSTGDTISNINKQINSDTVIKCTYQIGSFIRQDSVKLTVRNLPSKTITSNKKGLCKNDTISINVLPGFAYNWYKNNNIIAGTNNTLKANTIGNYKAKLTDSTGCSTMSDSVILFNAPLPVVKISLPDTALCLNGNVFKYTDSTKLDSGSFNRNWTFGNGNTSILSTSNQSYTSAGNYNAKLKVTTNYGCTDSTIKNITVKPNPVAGVMLGQVINLTPSTPYIYTVAQQINHLYNWVVTNGIVVLGQSTNAATVQWINNGDGYIKVEVTNLQGCLDTTAVATKIGNVGMNETSDINNLSLYPNPNYGSFTVGFTLKESSATKLELINMLGQQVWISNMQLQNGEQQIPINLSLSAGVYVLKITTSTGEITKQVLVK